MSTKKKDNTPHLETGLEGEMTLEKKSGARKSSGSDIQAKLEAGRAEIMKVVEGVPGSEKLSELIERGKKKGKARIQVKCNGVTKTFTVRVR